MVRRDNQLIKCSVASASNDRCQLLIPVFVPLLAQERQPQVFAPVLTTRARPDTAAAQRHDPASLRNASPKLARRGRRPLTHTARMHFAPASSGPPSIRSACECVHPRHRAAPDGAAGAQAARLARCGCGALLRRRGDLAKREDEVACCNQWPQRWEARLSTREDRAIEVVRRWVRAWRHETSGGRPDDA